MAEIEYNIHKYILISVESPDNRSRVFVTFFYKYRGIGSSYTESTMLHCHVSTVAYS